MVTAVTAVSDGRKGASKKIKGVNSSVSIDKSNFTVGMIDDEEFHMKTFDEGMIIMMMSMIIMIMSMMRMVVMVMMGMMMSMMVMMMMSMMNRVKMMIIIPFLIIIRLSSV